MHFLKNFFFLVIGIFFGIHAVCQFIPSKPIKVAVFAPIYIDAAFTDTTYILGKRNLPKQILAGLDFYNGILLAIDSLQTEKAPLEVYFFDTKSMAEPLEQIVENSTLGDVSLMIASLNSRNEVKLLADFALEHKIPFISTTYPNDGGVTDNPFFAMVNPTIITHIEAIYQYLHRNYPLEKINIFRKKGAIEDLIQNKLTELNKKTLGIPLKLNIISLDDDFNEYGILSNLDSTKKSIIVSGTLNETFGIRLIKTITDAKSYKATIIGMPTWDGIKNTGKETEIVYSTPYNFLSSEKLMQSIANKYKAKYAGRPSDMVFKGYESMYHFTKLLLKHEQKLINNLSDKEGKLFNDFDFQPTKSIKSSATPFYLENKKLYFIKKIDGRIKSIN